jgi:uracil-DNA glycosylase
VFDLAPLPHPSGASTWQHVEPGKTLLRQALALIALHPSWRSLQKVGDDPQSGARGANVLQKR